MRILALAAAVTIALVAAAAADPYPNQAAGITVDVPHGWKVGGEAQRMVASDPKEEAVMILIVTDGSDMKKAGAQLDADLAKTMSDVHWTAQQNIDLHGLKALAMKGTATISKRPAQIAAIITKTPTGKGLFVVGAVDAAKADAHKAELDGIIGSIRPIK